MTKIKMLSGGVLETLEEYLSHFKIISDYETYTGWCIDGAGLYVRLPKTEGGNPLSGHKEILSAVDNNDGTVTITKGIKADEYVKLCEYAFSADFAKVNAL